MGRKFADCGHAYDGATDSGYCKGCERDRREQMEREAERDAMREMGDERDPEDVS